MSVITDPDIIQYRCAVFEQKFHIAGATYVLNPYKYPGHSDFVINYDDVMNYRYVIRMWVNDGIGYGNPLYNEKTPIFKCYSSIEEMWSDAYRILEQADMRYARFSGSDVADDVAWINDSTTQNVGQKKANGLGLYDMSGDVWEWCLDYYKNDFYKDCKEGIEYKTKGYITNPACTDQSSSAHVFRGGSWLFSDKDCRNTCANYWIEDDEDNDLGFRIVIDNDKVDMKYFKKQ